MVICKTPIKTDPILNNYLTQTIDNNARSGVRRIASLCFFVQLWISDRKVIFSFPTCAVFQVLDQLLAFQMGDESSRNSESLIYAIIIPHIVKLGTASTCRERQ